MYLSADHWRRSGVLKDIEIDFRTHQAHRGGQRIDFTAREFDLLEYGVNQARRVDARNAVTRR